MADQEPRESAQQAALPNPGTPGVPLLVAQMAAVSWQGPIPDPQSALRYKEVDENWPERISDGRT